jgi:N-methylhydantoinase A
MREEGRKRLAAEGFAADRMRFEARLDMRYVGQAFELSVTMPDGARDMAEIDEAFLKAYAKRYSYAQPGAAEIVTFRLSAYGEVAKPVLPKLSTGGTPVPSGERQVAFDGAFRATPIFERTRLAAGAAIEGPAIIEEPGASTLVPPGFRMTPDEFGNLVLERR